MINDNFRKSSFSGGQNGSCVEIARADHLFGVRDSKNTAGPVLELTATHGHVFVAAVRDGRIGGVGTRRRSCRLSRPGGENGLAFTVKRAHLRAVRLAGYGAPN